MLDGKLTPDAAAKQAQADVEEIAAVDRVTPRR